MRVWVVCGLGGVLGVVVVMGISFYCFVVCGFGFKSWFLSGGVVGNFRVIFCGNNVLSGGDVLYRFV